MVIRRSGRCQGLSRESWTLALVASKFIGCSMYVIGYGESKRRMYVIDYGDSERHWLVETATPTPAAAQSSVQDGMRLGMACATGSVHTKVPSRRGSRAESAEEARARRGLLGAISWQRSRHDSRRGLACCGMDRARSYLLAPVEPPMHAWGTTTHEGDDAEIQSQ